MQETCQTDHLSVIYFDKLFPAVINLLEYQI